MTDQPDEPTVPAEVVGPTPVQTKKRTTLKIAGIAGGVLTAVAAIAAVVIRSRSENDAAEGPGATSAEEADSGSTCKDGWESPSTGSGTCSYHGGVA